MAQLGDYAVRETVFEDLVLEHKRGRVSHTIFEWEMGEERPTLAVLVEKAKEHEKVCDL